MIQASVIRRFWMKDIHVMLMAMFIIPINIRTLGQSIIQKLVLKTGYIHNNSS